jgi:hypothetical protein
MSIEIDIASFTLAEKDGYLSQIEQLIAKKRQILMEKKKTLNESLRENRFLEQTNQDYQKYYNYILQKKVEEYEAMQILNQYIHDLKMDTALTEKEIEQVKLDQRSILDSLKRVKKELDNITQNK